MNNKLEYSTILVELDCLFDTRLCTLVSMGEDTLNKSFNDKYHTRLIDRFNGIDNELYSNNYSNRNKDILKHAYITPIGDLLKEHSLRTHKLILTTPFHNKAKVIINIYPYVLDEEEINSLIQGVITITDGLSDVEVVNKSYEDLTPSYVKKLDMIILYNYDIWLETNSINKALTKVTCPDVELLGPAIFFKQIEDKTIKPYDCFKAMEEITAPFISLKLLPIKEFCVKLHE
jgi:hypothetical protein